MVEAYLALCGMHIYVHLVMGKIYVQCHQRMAPIHEKSSVCLLDRL
jgi:hypothetical protein